MFSLENIDFQFDADNEPDLSSKYSTHIGVFREPSKQDVNNKTTDCDTDNERVKPTAVRRKFPGPAGLLPDKPPRSFNDSSLILEDLESDVNLRSSEPIFCSQASESIFNELPFKKLKNDFELDKKDSALNGFTIDWVKKKALGKGLKGRKIPFLAVILQSVDCSSADPVVSLRDPSGELFGALHREAWKELGDRLQPGAAIALKEVGVLSTGVTRRQIILNMTKNNILSIYSSTEDGEISSNVIQATTTAELLKNVADWKARAAQISSPKPATEISNNLFLTHSTTSDPNAITYQNRSKPCLEKTESNFDLFTDDVDFASIDEICAPPTKKPKSDNSGSQKSSYNPDTQTVLSQAETSMLDEVLSGVDLDDF